MKPELDEEFREFMQSRWPAMVRLGYVLTGDVGKAQDLAQSAFTHAYETWPRVRRADSPDAYVRKILVNENSDRFRRRRVRERLTGTPPAGASADATRDSDQRFALIAALQKLGPRQRAVVVLRYWLGLSEAEVAAELNCSVGTVKSQASRALAALRTNPELVDEEHR